MAPLLPLNGLLSDDFNFHKDLLWVAFIKSLIITKKCHMVFFIEFQK